MTVMIKRIRGRTNSIIHSAKGSEWEEHKYIKKIDGNYYYPNSYEGGRHLESDEEKRIAADSNMDEKMIDTVARDVIRGLFGNGANRRMALGDAYQKIQDRVNQIIRSADLGNIKISDEKSSEIEKKGANAVKKVTSSAGEMDMNQIYSAYGGLEKNKLTKTSKESNVKKRRL